jgi:hypothetical protein
VGFPILYTISYSICYVIAFVMYRIFEMMQYARISSNRLLLPLFLILLISSSSSSSSTTTDPVHQDMMDVIFKQEQVIARLQSTVATLREENSLLSEQLRLLNVTSASVEGVAGSSSSLLRTEVLRLTQKVALEAALASSRKSSKAEGVYVDAGDKWTQPQHVSVMCMQGAEVQVRPLDIYDRPNDECFILDVRGQDLESRFVLYCDADSEAEGSRRSRDNEEGSGKDGEGAEET